MGFIADSASDDEIIRFRLQEIWEEYFPRYKGKFWHGKRPSFVIDRQNDIFLILISTGSMGEPLWANFLLYWKGSHIQCRLRIGEGSSKNFNDDPYVRIWELVEMRVPSALLIEEGVVKCKLKEALVAFGNEGVHNQRPNTVVKFRF